MIDAGFYDEFAYLGNTAYLDVCSLGLQPQRVLDQCAAFQRTFVDSLGRICLGGYDGVRKSAAERFAKLINGDAASVFFAENTTQGFQAMCSRLPIQRGEKVLICPQDYPSVTYGWLNAGVPTVVVPLRHGRLSEDEILDALDKEPIRAVSVSYVQSYSGYRLDLKRIGRACRERGIYFCVDAIQGLGRNPVDVIDDNIDVLSCGGFKALFGVLGISAHWCRRELMEKMTPVFCDQHNLQPGFDNGGSARPIMGPGSSLFAGSGNSYGVTALNEGMGLLLEIGIPEIREKVLSLEKYYRSLLADMELDWIGGTCEDEWSGNAVFAHDGTRVQRLAEEIKRNQIMVHLHDDHFRIGIHYYNTQEHIERMASVVRKVFGN